MKNLNKTILSLLAIGVATLGVSCQKSTVEVAPTTTTEGTVTVLSASTPSTAETRLNIEHDYTVNGDPISITWQNNSDGVDEVSVFDANTRAWVANFKYSDLDGVQTGEFTIVDGGTPLSEGSYVAVYPAVDGSVITTLDQRNAMEISDSEFTSGDVENSWDIKNDKAAERQLNQKVWMKANFSVTGERAQTMVFEHETAVIFVRYPITTTNEIPQFIHIRDGENDYRVNNALEFTATTGSAILTYFVVRPNSGERTLHFSGIDSTDPEYTRHYTVQTSNEYQAGMLYMADLSTFPSPAENIAAIYRGSDLALFRDAINASTDRYNYYDVKLMNDITLEGEWEPIANVFEIFYSGTFDGNGHSISGLSINTPDRDKRALIGYSNGTIKDLTVIEPIVYGENTVSAIHTYGGAYIINCGVIGGSIKSEGSRAGAISAGNVNGKIIGCYSSATVEANYASAGGIIGSGQYATIIGCYSTGNIISRTISPSIGGVAGISDNATIIGCYTTSSYTNSPHNSPLGYYSESNTDPTVKAVYYLSNEATGLFGSVNSVSYQDLNMNKVALMNAEIEAAGYSVKFTANDNFIGAGPTLRGEVL